MFIETDPMLSTDSYKLCHHALYPKGLEIMQSHLAARVPYGIPITSFGVQYYAKMLAKAKPKPYKTSWARNYTNKHIFGNKDVFNEYDWVEISNLGYLPVEIWAYPEGTRVQGGDPIMVVQNSTPGKFPWLVNHLETFLSRVWYPMTIATNSKSIYKSIIPFMESTTDLTKDEIKAMTLLKVHDFGSRGVSSSETAALGAAAHLLTFDGSDTIEGDLLIRNFYTDTRKGKGKPMPKSTSIVATEHSVMTMRGIAGELEVFKELLKKFPDGPVACVIDSFDWVNFIVGISENEEIMEMMEARQYPVIFRPDSGDPVVTTEKLFNLLFDKFGGYLNRKGYKVLSKNVQIIQGDGINKEMIIKILQNFKDNYISAQSIGFGSGGGLLQKFDRDTFKFAFKCNWVRMNGVGVDVYKSPMEFNSDGEYVQSFKKSIKGYLNPKTLGMQLVYKDGVHYNEEEFITIKERIHDTL